MDESIARFPNVYINGAQCTGKTTIVNKLEELLDDQHGGSTRKEQYNPVIIREVAQTVLREKGFNRDDITNCPPKAYRLQELILKGQ